MLNREEIKKLIDIHCRRLQILKEQQAKLGIATPAQILMDLERIEAAIEELEENLKIIKDGNPVRIPVDEPLRGQKNMTIELTYDETSEKYGTQKIEARSTEVKSTVSAIHGMLGAASERCAAAGLCKEKEIFDLHSKRLGALLEETKALQSSYSSYYSQE